MTTKPKVFTADRTQTISIWARIWRWIISLFRRPPIESVETTAIAGPWSDMPPTSAAEVERQERSIPPPSLEQLPLAIDPDPTAEVFYGMSYEDYDAIDAVRSSLLADVHESPRNALWWMSNRKETVALTIGSGVHGSVFDPINYWKDTVIKPAKLDLRTTAGKAWARQHADQTILKGPVALRIQKAVAELKTHKGIKALLDAKGHNEIVIVWTHRRTGIRCKARIDKVIPNRAIVELKTSRYVRAALFCHDAAKWAYHLRLAFYSDAVVAAGFGRLPVKVPVVQTCAPWDRTIFNVPEMFLTEGTIAYDNAIDTLIQCKESNEWPGVAEDREQDLHLPGWALPDLEQADWGE
jgi:hypothetical protein